jgi:acyl-homoserine-lactone acylase
MGDEIVRSGGEKVRLYRDRFGVPHVVAESVEGAYFGLGYCAAQDRPQSLILHQYIVQGRLSEHLGRKPLTDPLLTVLTGLRRTPMFSEWAPSAWSIEDTVDVDRWTRLNGYWRTAQEQLGSLGDRSATAVHAFAAGVNRYFETAQAPDYAEPYEAAAEIAWWGYFEHHVAMSFFASNAFSVAPSRSADGAAWLGGDTHYWFFDGWSEAHVQAGSFQVAGIWDGHVNLGMWGGTNGRLAMAVTAAGLEGASVYREHVNPDDRDQYWSAGDGAYRPFESRREVIEVLGEEPVDLVVRRTHHGPVVAEELRDGAPAAYTVRSLFAEHPADALSQHLGIWTCDSVDEFIEHAQQSPFVRGHRQVADTAGNIAYVCNGPAPVRDPDIDWSKPVDARLPEAEWGSAGGWDAERWVPGDGQHGLPIIHNPSSGFLQNANDPPWVVTVGAEVSDSYPKYLFPDGWRELGTRGARQRAVLAGRDKLDPEQLRELVVDVYVPHAHLGIAALREEARSRALLGDGVLSEDAALVDGTLAEWDGMAAVDSTGMTLAFWLNRVLPGGIPAPVISPTADPSREAEMGPPTVDGAQAAAYVAALTGVAQEMRERYGKIEKPWGEIHGLDRAGDLAALPGGANELRSLSGTWSGWWVGGDHLEADGTERCDFGTRHVRLTRLTPDGVEVHSVSVTGQFPLHEHPGSRHGTDQTELYASLRLKRVPLSPEEIEAEAAVAPGDGANYQTFEEIEVPQ